MQPIVEKYLNSRKGKVLEEIKSIFASGCPIVFLKTSEPDFAQLVTEELVLFPQDIVEKYNDGSYNDIALFRLNQLQFTKIKSPALFVHTFSGGTKQTTIESAIEKLQEFVRLYCRGISSEADENSRNIHSSFVLIITPGFIDVPDDLADYSRFVIVPPLSDDEILQCVEHEGHLPRDEASQLIKNLRGMTERQIVYVIRRMQLLDEIPFEQIIASEKKQKMMGTGILSLVEDVKSRNGEKNLAAPAGMGQLFGDIRRIAPMIANPVAFYKKWGKKAPKGMLVSGIPGTGKSMMARCLAARIGVPLLRMDMGDVLNKFVGDSEHRMTEALLLAESMSPCVLWIDEIEKAFAGSDGNGNSDVVQRLFGKFLTWMQEKERKTDVSCFVFATANKISGIPPELFRSGRFDKKYYTFVPSAKECSQIFSSIIREQCEEYAQRASAQDGHRVLFDLSKINQDFFLDCLQEQGETTKIFIGSDIGEVIEDAKSLYISTMRETGKDCIYQSEAFKGCVRESLSKCRSYGETNLSDIVSCYIRLKKNNFIPVSEDVLMPFEFFSETSDQPFNWDDYHKELERKERGPALKYDEAVAKRIADELNGPIGKNILEKINQQ